MDYTTPIKHNDVSLKGEPQLKMLQRTLGIASEDPVALYLEADSNLFKGLTRDEFNSVKPLVEKAKKDALFNGIRKSIDESMEMIRKKVFKDWN